MTGKSGLTTKQKEDVQGVVTAEVAKVNWVMSAVVIVLFVGIATMFVAVWGLILDSNRFKTETYQNLVDKVNDQNFKINILNQRLEIIESGLRKHYLIP